MLSDCHANIPLLRCSLSRSVVMHSPHWEPAKPCNTESMTPQPSARTGLQLHVHNRVWAALTMRAVYIKLLDTTETRHCKLG